MNFSRMGLLLFIVFGWISPSNAQLINRFDAPDYELNYKEFSAILLNGVPIIRAGAPDGPLRLDAGSSGKLSVSTIDRSGKEMRPVKSIGFRVGIKNHRTNTLWMYSEETLFEVDLEAIRKKCEMGDMLIFMTVDRKYQLPRHQIASVVDGC